MIQSQKNRLDGPTRDTRMERWREKMKKRETEHENIYSKIKSQT